jgi:hypothetical protein
VGAVEKSVNKKCNTNRNGGFNEISVYNQPLFYALVAFLIKWTQMKRGVNKKFYPHQK